MSVEKQLKATSGYGMLAAVIAALLAIVGLFIWSLAGIAGTPDGVDAPAVYGWGLGFSIVAFCFWFLPLTGLLLPAARSGARVHPLWQVRGHRARRGLFLGKPVL